MIGLFALASVAGAVATVQPESDEVPPVPVRTPPERVSAPATLISSAAPDPAVVLPRSLAVFMVSPLADA